MRFLKAKVPIKTIETVAHSFIKDLLASLFPRWKTSKVLYLLAMLVAVPALFSWGNSKSGTSWPRNSQSRSQPSPTLNTSKFSGRTKPWKISTVHLKNLWEGGVYLHCCIVPGVGVFPDRGANIGSDGRRNIKSLTSTGSREHQIEHWHFICRRIMLLLLTRYINIINLCQTHRDHRGFCWAKAEGNKSEACG